MKTIGLLFVATLPKASNLQIVTRLFSVLALLVLFSVGLKAQDLIVTQKGETIKVYQKY